MNQLPADDLHEVSCADPESFFRGGPTLTGFFFSCEGIQIPLKAGHHKRHLNGVSLTGRLNAGPAVL